MSPERRQINKLLFHMLDLCCQSITMDKNWPTFQAYLEDLPNKTRFNCAISLLPVCAVAQWIP